MFPLFPLFTKGRIAYFFVFPYYYFFMTDFVCGGQTLYVEISKVNNTYLHKKAALLSAISNEG